MWLQCRNNLVENVKNMRFFQGFVFIAKTTHCSRFGVTLAHAVPHMSAEADAFLRSARTPSIPYLATSLQMLKSQHILAL